ncbi:hypothetical protein ACW7EJ_07300, partial [Acinetobacter soli]
WKTTPIVNIEITNIEKGISNLLNSNVNVKNINRMKKIISDHFDEIAQSIDDYNTKNQKETV